MALLDGAFGAFASFLQPEPNFFLATVAIFLSLAYFFKEYKRLPAIAAVIALTFLLGVALKPALAQVRPCALGGLSAVPCPGDFSLPSIHTAIAFGFVASTVGLRAFPLYFIWGVLVAVSRLHLGVHSVIDIGAGIALALFSTALIDSLGIAGGGIFSKRGLLFSHSSSPRPRANDEFTRKIVQAIIGLSVMAIYIKFGQEAAVLGVVYLLAAGLVLFHIKAYRLSVPFIDLLLFRLERPGDKAGFGALNFFVGILISITLIPSGTLALSMLFVLSVSDGAAAFFGPRFRGALPHHPNKTISGSAAFFITSLPVYFIGGAGAIFAAALATLIESLPLDIDDNITIPWAGVIVFALTA